MLHIERVKKLRERDAKCEQVRSRSESAELTARRSRRSDSLATIGVGCEAASPHPL
jgi:hypothetical protein